MLSNLSVSTVSRRRAPRHSSAAFLILTPSLQGTNLSHGKLDVISSLYLLPGKDGHRGAGKGIHGSRRKSNDSFWLLSSLPCVVRVTANFGDEEGR